ncbi:LysR substrate-binding domain-containing protein [Roseateles aquae]
MQLGQLALLVLLSSIDRQIHGQTLAALGAQPDIRYRLSQLLSILGFVRQGLTLSMAARMALPDEPEGVVYRPLRPAIPRRVGLAVRDPQRLSPAAAAFMAMARRVYPG